MSYLEFFGLSQEPFSNAPVAKFFYNSEQHAQALTRLRYAADHMKGLALLVGRIGTGKTTLARRMLDSLPEDHFEAALLVIIHSGISATWLLKRIALQLGVKKPANDKLTLLSQLYQRLLQIHQQGRKAVVLIDEAQMLKTREIMEEFRGLLNLEIPGNKLISFVFFGLPELEKGLQLDPPLLQRVALKCRLESFSPKSTSRYVEHRLKMAGATQSVFTDKALSLIHQHSRGIPRVINTLCDNSMFEGFMRKLRIIDESLIHTVAVDLSLVHESTVALKTPPQPAAESVPQQTSNVVIPITESPDVSSQLPEAPEQTAPTSKEDEYEEVFERFPAEETVGANEHSDIDAILEGIVEKN